jgi:gluconate 5-dehydrogenase
MFDLTGKVALVTGASRGLGWAMAQSLAQAGAHVVLNARDEAALGARVAELAAQGLSSEACAFDVTDSALAQRRVAELAACHGRFDILVANAGINHRQPIVDFELADFQRVLDTNLVAVWVLCKAAAQQMVPRRQGRLILTGSISAMNARPTISAYVASKGAVHSLTKQLAVELARDGITANCIAPGFFATEMNTALIENPAFNEWVCQRTPAGRWGRLSEIGPAAVFLASDEASYVSGLVLTVDGAFTAAM